METQSDYSKYRGKCREAAKFLAKENPALRVVRGHYFCPIWNKEEQHWWCETIDGVVVDPTAKQFPSKGCGIYTEFNGTCECSNCGKKFNEKDSGVDFSGRYAFCSYKCHGQFVGVL